MADRGGSVHRVPLLSNGRDGPALRLRGLFEMYDGQAAAADTLEEADAAAATRAIAERDTQTKLWAR